MKRTILILYIAVLTISAHAQIVVPLSLPDNCNIQVGTNEQPTQDAALTIKILPNPNSGSFTLSVESSTILGNIHIGICNSVGVECFQLPAYCDSKKMIRKMELGDLPNGVYFLKIIAGKSEMHSSFTIQN